MFDDNDKLRIYLHPDMPGLFTVTYGMRFVLGVSYEEGKSNFIKFLALPSEMTERQFLRHMRGQGYRWLRTYRVESEQNVMDFVLSGWPKKQARKAVKFSEDMADRMMAATRIVSQDPVHGQRVYGMSKGKLSLLSGKQEPTKEEWPDTINAE